MQHGLSASDAGKFAAARRAVDLVEDGMKLGLGTGSTAAWMVRCLAARARAEGLRLTCAATSARTAQQAQSLGLTVVPLDAAGPLDLTIDGADEFDPTLDLIKGGGGAHLREKVVAAASERMVVITDPSKQVARLGAFPLPVEVLAFGLEASQRMIRQVLEVADYLDVAVTLRETGGAPFVTDEGNRILDLHMDSISDAGALDAALLAVPGVLQTGLFLGMCDAVVIGHPDGRAEMRGRDGSVETQCVDLADASALPEAENM